VTHSLSSLCDMGPLDVNAQGSVLTRHFLDGLRSDGQHTQRHNCSNPLAFDPKSMAAQQIPAIENILGGDPAHHRASQMK